RQFRPRSGVLQGLRAELSDGIAAELTEHPIDLGSQHRERAIHARLAAGGEAIERRAADHHRLGTERERFDDVGAAAEAAVDEDGEPLAHGAPEDRKSTRLNSSHLGNSYAVFCLKKK